MRSSGKRSAHTAVVVGAVLVVHGCAAVDVGGVSLVPLAGSSLLAGLTAATGDACQIYFIKGLVDTALTLVSRVGDEIDSVVSSVSGEAVFCVRAGLRASAAAVGVVCFFMTLHVAMYLAASVWIEMKTKVPSRKCLNCENIISF